MSGGHFDYIHAKEPSDLVHMLPQLAALVAHLSSVGYAEDVAIETAELLVSLKQEDARIKAKIERLAPVWKALDYWICCDSSEEDFKKALAVLRGATTTAVGKG